MFGFGRKIDIRRINEELTKGIAILVDVRSDEEWRLGHAARATHLAIDRILQGEVPTNDTTKKVYLYCASGSRSNVATKSLSQKGYNAENIGGISNWRQAGGKIQ